MINQTNTRTIEPDITIFAITGRLSLGNTLLSIESAIRRLIEEGARKLIIDIAQLTYIDSAAIGMLIASNGLVEQWGGQLRIAGAQGLVAKSFALVHLDRIIALEPDADAATRSFAASA